MKVKRGTIEVAVELEQGRLRSAQVEKMYALAYVLGKTEPVARAALDASGKAALKIPALGGRLPPVEVEVCAMARPRSRRRFTTTRMAVEKWEEGKAQAVLSLSAAFYEAVAWLDKPFVVEGVVVSRHEDPDTEEMVEWPIQFARVTLYDVDKQSLGAVPCNVVCLPDLGCEVCLVCVPVVEGPCTPGVCLPLTTCDPVFQCKPVVVPEFEELCFPSDPRAGCAPYNPDIFEHDHVIREWLEARGSLAKRVAQRPGRAMRGRYATKPVPMSASLPIMEVHHAEEPIALMRRAPSWALAYTKNQICDEDSTDQVGRFRFEFTRRDFFEAPEDSTYTEDEDWDAWPDLLFEAELYIDGAWRSIYSEPYSETRWNEDEYTWVKLVVEGEYGAPNVDGDLDLSQTEDFLFHGIGDVEPGWIDGNGVISSPPVGHAWKDHVFGSTLTLKGQFAVQHIGRFYQVEIQANGSSAWEPVCGETWYYSRYQGDGVWKTLVRAPADLGPDLSACYPIPDYYDFLETNKTVVLKWSTTRKDGNIRRYPDGIYKLRVRVIDKQPDGSGVVVDTSVYDPAQEQLDVQVDNGWPLAHIAAVYAGTLSGTTLNLQEVPECGMVHNGADRYLVFEFQAEDPENHFRSYTLQMNRGQDQPVALPVSQPTVNNVVPSVSGFALSPPQQAYVGLGDNYPRAFTALYLGDDPWDAAADVLKPCAYNFTLTVRDRVINGYGHLHWTHWLTTLSILPNSGS